MGYTTGTTKYFVDKILNEDMDVDLSRSIITDPINPALDAAFAYTRIFGRPSGWEQQGLTAEEQKYYGLPDSKWKQTQGYYYRTLPNTNIKGWVFESDYAPRSYPRIITQEHGVGSTLFCDKTQYEFHSITPEKVKQIENHEASSLKGIRYSDYTPI